MYVWAALLTLSLVSCEKTQTEIVQVGGDFCPVNFGYEPEQSILPGCNVPNQSELEATLALDSVEGAGVLWTQPLFRENRPYISALGDVSNRFKAFHLSSDDCAYSFRFDKVSMDTATRVSFYLGQTRLINQGNPPIYYKGNFPAYIEPGPSLKHTWQVFVQREASGKYTLAYMADSVLYTVASDINDFDTAEFVLGKNTEEGTFIRGNLFKNTDSAPSTVATFEKKSMLVDLPNNLFPGIGANVMEAFQDDCDIKKVVVRLRLYLYNDFVNSESLFDTFECNTVLK
jgi:hypothetical protein